MKQNHDFNTSKPIKIKFLPDSPLFADLTKDISFGHESIANNLKEIIESCPSPFTIGLFGKWGTGKTSIVNLLINKLKTSSKNINVAKIDVWKYEGDSLRRQFLISLDEELSLGLKYKETLNQTLTESDPTKGVIKYDLGLLINLASLIALGLLLAGIILKISIPKMISVTPDLLIQFGLFGFLAQFVIGLFKRVSVTITEHRTDSAEGFEKKFNEKILGNEKLKEKRLLIIIDNLDRSSHSKAVEMLSTIKTFLAKDEKVQTNCIFLITCDDEAIKQHIKSIYLKECEIDSSGPFDVDEFLRKFFNAFIRIPTFIDTELQVYTEKLLKETGAPQFDSSDLAYVITSSFRENPRQIKQFINTLLAHFLLSKEREDGEKPLISQKGTVTGNVAFLAKLFIIRQRFPSIYRKIEREYLTTDEMEAINISDSDETKEFKDFLRATKTITAADIRPFIHLKQSEEELTIPGIRELEFGLMDNKPKIVIEKFNIIKTNPNQLESIKRFIPNLIDKNMGRRQLLLNIISCSLESLRQSNIQLGNDFYDKIGNLLTNKDALKSEIQRLEPSFIFGEVLMQCNVTYRNEIVTQYVELFSSQKTSESGTRLPVDYACNLLKEFLAHKDWVRDKLEIIKSAITDIYSAEIKILALLKDKSSDQKDFISEETLFKLIGTLSDQDVEGKEKLKEKIELLINFKNIASLNVANSVIKLANQLLNNENQKPYRDVKENLLNCITNVLKTYEALIIQITDKTELNRLSDTAIQGMNKIADWSQQKVFIPTCLILFKLDTIRKHNINSQIQNFFTSADTKSLDFIFKPIETDAREDLIKRFESVFRPRVQQDQAVFDLLYLIAPPDIRIQWLSNLINSPYYMRALKKLEEPEFKVDDVKITVEKLLAQVVNVGPADKGNFYSIINKMKCANSPELTNIYITQLKSYLKNSNQALQKIGHEVLQGAEFLSDTIKREITRETVEWLRTLDPTNAYQPYSIRGVLVNWNILESQKPLQNEYLDFVFDKLVKRATILENIRLGLEILFEIKPNYKDYQAYFDDVYAKMEKETNAQIKTELISGFKKLQPSKLNKDNEQFWKKVETL